MVLHYCFTTKLSKDGKSLTFETDKFSTYALAYSDVASSDVSNVKNPPNL